VAETRTLQSVLQPTQLQLQQKHRQRHDHAFGPHSTEPWLQQDAAVDAIAIVAHENKKRSSCLLTRLTHGAREAPHRFQREGLPLLGMIFSFSFTGYIL